MTSILQRVARKYVSPAKSKEERMKERQKIIRVDNDPKGFNKIPLYEAVCRKLLKLDEKPVKGNRIQRR